MRFVKVDTDENEQLASTLQVYALPTVAFIQDGACPRPNRGQFRLRAVSADAARRCAEWAARVQEGSRFRRKPLTPEERTRRESILQAASSAAREVQPPRAAPAAPRRLRRRSCLVRPAQ